LGLAVEVINEEEEKATFAEGITETIKLETKLEAIEEPTQKGVEEENA
jgi:hypothetical protein